MSRRRRIVSVLLLVLLVVTTVLAIVALWAKRQVLDEKTWRHTNTELISDPAIQAAVAGYIVDSIYKDGKVASTIERALPGRLKPLGGPISGALREGLEHTARTALQRPELQRAWSSVVDVTHKQVIALVEDKHTPLRRLTGKNAILDLRPLIGDVSLRLGLPPSIIDQLPPDAGRIRVVSDDELAGVQTALKLTRLLVIFLVLLVPLLIGILIWIAPAGDRRVAALKAGAAVALGALVVLGLRGAAAGPFIDAVAPDYAGRAAINSMYGITTTVLRDVAGVTLALAFVLLGGALLAGPGGSASRIRAGLRPALLRAPEVVHGVVLAVLVAAVAASLIPGIRRPLGIVLLLAAAATATELVRRAAVDDARRAPAG